MLDETDRKILMELQADSRLSVRQLAARVHRSSTPVHERLHRLEESGVIKAYTIEIDREKAGCGFTVFCNVKLSHINSEMHEAFATAVMDMAEVSECHNISGDYDYMLKVEVPDMKSYRRFVTETLGRLPMLDAVHSVFVMDTIKQLPPPIVAPSDISGWQRGES